MAGSLVRFTSQRFLSCQRNLFAPAALYHARAKVGNRDIVGYGFNGEPTYLGMLLEINKK